MKQHLSVLMLTARSTIYKFLLLLGLTAAAELCQFWLTLRAALETFAAGGGMASPETVLYHSRVSWTFAVCFVLTAALLGLTGCEFGSRQGYTLRRLSVSEKSVFLWQSGYNAACFFLLWAFQTLLALGLCALYMALADPGQTSGQTVFLAFYRSEFLHSLLPLAGGGRWARNALLVLGMGASSAYFPYSQRRGKFAAWLPLLTALAAVCFSAGLAAPGNELLVMAASAAAGASAMKTVLGGAADETS